MSNMYLPKWVERNGSMVNLSRIDSISVNGDMLGFFVNGEARYTWRYSSEEEALEAYIKIVGLLLPEVTGEV